MQAEFVGPGLGLLSESFLQENSSAEAIKSKSVFFTVYFFIIIMTFIFFIKAGFVFNFKRINPRSPVS